MILGGTGKFFSEALILASPNPQYENLKKNLRCFGSVGKSVAANSGNNDRKNDENSNNCRSGFERCKKVFTSFFFNGKILVLK